ncbi:MAG TPA: dynamin family protein, partial [Candidatus Tumulicola sp.]|nr:dynamin family protein [Candidatus Tumulicola sp.]
MSRVDVDAMRRYEATRDELIARLHELEDLLEGERRATVARSRQRLARGKFVLAVVGEFSSGKSFLLNALLGKFRYEGSGERRDVAGLLATDINPSTATITELEYGKNDEATAYFDDGRAERVPLDSLSRFVAVGKGDAGTIHDAAKDERDAPTRVAIKSDSPFLERGFVVADTPGLASINPAHRRATLQFLPTADAVLYLIDTQQPFAEGDASFLGIVRQHIDSIFIVQTKIDLWRAPQSDGVPAWERAYERIARLAAVHAPGTYVYALSAREYAQGVLDGDSAAIGRSRFGEFLAALDASLITRTGRARLVRARERAAAAAADEAARLARDLEMLALDEGTLQRRRAEILPQLVRLDDDAAARRASLLAD